MKFIERLQAWEVRQKGLLWVVYALAAIALITVLLRPVNAQRILAQITGGHNVALSWVLSTDDTTAGCTAPNTCAQTVYRAPGACSTSSTFASIGSPSATGASFTDSTIVPGTYCYGVSFTQNGLESAKDTTTVILPPASPTSLGGIPH